MPGGYGGTLRRVPPVYPHGSARAAVGFAINLTNQIRSHLINTSQTKLVQTNI